MFCKKGVLRNFTKFTGKHLCQSIFFNKVAGPVTLFKKRLWQRCFPLNFVRFLRTPFLKEHLWWLLLRGDIIFKSKDIADTSNEFFGSTVESLGLYMWTKGSKAFPGYARDVSIDNNLMKCVNYPSIRKIKQNLSITSKFLFQPVSVNNVKQVIKDLILCFHHTGSLWLRSIFHIG